jgi:hypothetical protein
MKTITIKDLLLVIEGLPSDTPVNICTGACDYGEAIKAYSFVPCDSNKEILYIEAE